MGSGQNQTELRKQEQLLGRLLQVGVILAAAVVLGGGIIYLLNNGARRAEFSVFHGDPIGLHRLDEIMKQAGHLQGRALIQFGLLLLIATPIARVLFSVLMFFRQRDFTYVAITVIVLVLLLFSLFGGGF